MKADFVDPAPLPIECREFGRIAVGQDAPLEHMRRAAVGPQGGEQRVQPVAATAPPDRPAITGFLGRHHRPV